MNSPFTFVIFTGYNDRAVITLCRFFRMHNLKTALVASGVEDLIFKTDYKDNVIYIRKNKIVDFLLFEEIEKATSGAITICPTTEFINTYILENRERIKKIFSTNEKNETRFNCGLPGKEIYKKLTEKLSSQQIAKDFFELEVPEELDWPPDQAPCVLKPKQNIAGITSLYPLICNNDVLLNEALNTIPYPTSEGWFAQKFIEGQSLYLCGYLSRSGERAYYWQENLLQQPGGKSITLARSIEDPAYYNSNRLFDVLYEIGYHGPFMMEVLCDYSDKLYYIEINPRFWGPLQLSILKNQRLLELFINEYGEKTNKFYKKNNGTYWYAWAFGMKNHSCKIYPALKEIGELTADSPLIVNNDIYRGKDTILLHREF